MSRQSIPFAPDGGRNYGWLIALRIGSVCVFFGRGMLSRAGGLKEAGDEGPNRMKCRAHRCQRRGEIPTGQPKIRQVPRTG